jgi:hypothetical protein
LGFYYAVAGMPARRVWGLALCGVLAFGFPVAVRGGGEPVFFLEELDEVRGVGESTFVADFRDRLVGRDQQQARVHEPLLDEPAVGRLLEMAAELHFEGGHAAVALFGQAFDGYVAENVAAHHLLETFAQRVGDVCHVVVSRAQIERRAARDLLAAVAVVYVFGAPDHVTYGVPCEVLRPDAVAHRLDVFYDHRLLCLSRVLCCHNAIFKRPSKTLFIFNQLIINKINRIKYIVFHVKIYNKILQLISRSKIRTFTRPKTTDGKEHHIRPVAFRSRPHLASLHLDA